MALLKSYSCVKCGGVLNFDEDQEVFGCPFCGGEFAFTDFHRGDLIKQGKMALNRENYFTAKDKFQAILKRNPRDFEALQGLILAEGNIPAVNRLCRIEYLEDAKLKEAIEATKKAKEALNEESEYFGILISMFELAYKYHKSSDETDIATKAKNKHFRAMSYELIGIEEREEVAFDGFKKVLVFLASRVLPVFLAVSIVSGLWWITAGFVGLVALTGGIIKLYYFSQKKRIDSRLSSEMRQQFDEEDTEFDKLKNIRNEYIKTYIKLKKIVPDPKAYEKPLPPEKKDTSVTDDPFMNIEKNVICNKCGGQLVLDKEKNLYECRSCGVAYGASLFFGDPFKKAAKALKENDFEEAEQRYSYILMMDPHVFEALLGRILCAGQWKSINDISLTDEAVPEIRLDNIKGRADEAVMHVAEEDMSFMEDIRKLIYLYCDYEQAAQAADIFNGLLENISRNRLALLADKDNEDSPLKNENDYVIKRRAELAKKHDSKNKFDELKAKLLLENTKRLSKE